MMRNIFTISDIISNMGPIRTSPLLSIVTVCRNAESGLRKTTESIDAQTFQDWEHIVIDGDSQDATVDFLQKTKSEKRHFISEPDAGIYNAMNKGARLSQGVWLLFLNAGDIFIAPDSLITLFQKVEELKGLDWFGADVKFFGSEHIFRSIYFRNGKIQFHPHQGTFYSRSFLSRKGYFREDFRIAADYAFAFEHFSTSRYKLFSHVVSIIEPNGISYSSSFQKLKECLFIRAFLGNCEIKDRIRMVVGYLLGFLNEWISSLIGARAPIAPSSTK